MRREPKPTVAVDIEDGKCHRFESVNAMCRKLGTTVTYALRRLNTGTPAKGYLLFTADRIDSPEAQEQCRLKVNGWQAKQEARQAKKKQGLVSVYVDRKTTLLVPAEKWTPDYAERWKARMAASQPLQRQNDSFITMNDRIKEPRVKRGPGRPRKENR